MPLIITTLVFLWIGDPPHPIAGEASRYYISLPSRYLSESYELNIGDLVLGTTEELSVSAGGQPMNEQLVGKSIKFVLHSSLGYDHLFISKKNWEEFRDWGLVEPGYILQVRLLTAVKKFDKKEITLYSKVDKTI